MRILVVCLIIVAGLGAKAQNNPPVYNPRSVRLAIPAYLPAAMPDSSATLRNDTMFYNLTGQVFGNNGFKVKTSLAGNRASFISKTSTPWETITSLAQAYSKKDKSLIASLYNNASRGDVENLLNGSQSNEFLDYAYKVANANLKIMGGFLYEGGVLVFVKDDLYGVHLNYLVKEGNRYLLSKFEDKKPTSWNLNVYFTLDPKPIAAIRNISVPAKLSMNDSVRLNVNISAPAQWVSVFTAEPGESVKILVEDNGKNDLNKSAGKVSFYLPGYIFPSTGEQSFYISASNFPIQRVSSSFIKTDAKYKIMIEE